MKVTGVRWSESANRRKNRGLVNIIGKPKTVQKFAEDNNINFSINRQGGVVLNDDNADTRRFVEHCYRTTSTIVNPIVDWTDKDVWKFLHFYGCQSNPLYQCGQRRIGCIGCPMKGPKGMKSDFARYPKYRQVYVRAFDKMVRAIETTRLKQDNGSWIDGEHVMRWWVEDDLFQMTLFDYISTEEIET